MENRRSEKPPRMGSEKPARIRRTAEESRTAILDAAERRLGESGPSGIRLQDVAADVGVAHPTILHHFGSRERLVDEVVKRRIESMKAEVLHTLAGGIHDQNAVENLFERLFATFGPGGHARTVAFLALEGHPGVAIDGVEPLARVTHATRLAECPVGGQPPSFEDTYFTVLLVAVALFGDAIAGRIFRGHVEEKRDAETSARFRAWLAALVHAHLESARKGDPAKS